MAGTKRPGRAADRAENVSRVAALLLGAKPFVLRTERRAGGRGCVVAAVVDGVTIARLAPSAGVALLAQAGVR